MKHRTIVYWASTILLALAFLAGGLYELSATPDVIVMFAHLGYPAYIPVLLGAWKVLGALAILVPRTPRLKEWAYAGMVFDLTGAMVSHLFVGDAAGNLVAPLVLLGLVVVSWALRPADRMLAASSTTRT